MNEIPQIQISEAKQMFDQKECTFIDIRDSGFYEAAHVPGAMHLLVYCYHGNCSLNAAAYLIENGFKNVCSMSGGFEAWRLVYEHEPG